MRGSVVRCPRGSHLGTQSGTVGVGCWGGAPADLTPLCPAPPVIPVARSDAHSAHKGSLYLQLMGGGAAPPGDRRPED